MRYRALLVDPGNTSQERPVEVLGNHRGELERWARAVLSIAVSPDAVVKLYEYVEQQIALIPKAKVEAAK